MSTDYIVKIPEVLTKLLGPQNIRTEIEEGVKLIFEEWANPALVSRIKVTKPRGGKDE